MLRSQNLTIYTHTLY